jgi:hypothetical protein
VRDLPIVEQPAELLGRAVEKRLLLGGQLGRREILEPPPVRHAREELAVPPDVAGFERFLLRPRHARQHVPVDAEEAPRDVVAANRFDVEERKQHEQRNQQRAP